MHQQTSIQTVKEDPLNIVVCVKQTPDTAATVIVEDGKVSWGDAPLVLNPWDEYAVEEALRLKEAHGGQVTAISLGPEGATEALKQALAMGCDTAILVSDPKFAGLDSLQVSKVLAAAVKKVGEVDLLFFGRASVDSDVGITGSQVARRLGWPALTLVAAIRSVDPGAKSISVERMLDEGRQKVSGPLPAVMSVVKEINEPRYPSFMGIRKASKAEIPVWSAADIDLTEALEPAVAWPQVNMPPKVDTQCELIEGGSAEEIAQKLVDRLVEEKVI
ncbi:MAG: electron transfer flavoprotein beta subunit/FixA family protein [Anaerolineales bacterium]|nr:MAG: electron transfer flavoprotein beta subunit/FixA family protein [Anaerolineales bacterium]